MNQFKFENKRFLSNETFLVTSTFFDVQIFSRAIIVKFLLTKSTFLIVTGLERCESCIYKILKENEMRRKSIGNLP